MINVYWGTEYLDDMLKVIKNHDAKVTFFVGGSWAAKNKEYLDKMIADGHEIGNHGYFHKDHSKMGYEANLEEIRPSVKILEMICGEKIKLFAPPSGAFCEDTLSACAQLDMRVIMWSRDTIDWRDKDVNVIVNRATQNLKNGEFILMHPKDVTVEALPKILTYIRENGLKTAAVSHNLGE